MTIPDFTGVPLLELLSLRGRRAVVTGGARGIGAQTALRLAEAGADVVIGDLDGAAASDWAGQVGGRTGRTVLGVPLDVAETDSIVATAETAVDRLGGLDIWINNAGIFPTTGPAIDAPDELIDRLLRVNTRGSFAGAREAARRMTGGGVIVNVLSTSAFKAGPGISAYATSKHALVGTTKVLALEFGPLGIRVLGVAPTIMDTPGIQEQLAPLKEAGLDVQARVAANPLGRMGVPDDVARVIVFACSDLAAFMTGSTLAVDAGSLC